MIVNKELGGSWLPVVIVWVWPHRSAFETYQLARRVALCIPQFINHTLGCAELSHSLFANHSTGLVSFCRHWQMIVLGCGNS